MHPNRLIIQTAAGSGGLFFGMFGAKGSGAVHTFIGPTWDSIFLFLFAVVFLICSTIIIVTYLNRTSRK